MTIYRSDKRSDPIFFHSGGKINDSAGSPDWPKEKQGWYFCDETWSDYLGPYESYGLCEEAIARYVKECL